MTFCTCEWHRNTLNEFSSRYEFGNMVGFGRCRDVRKDMGKFGDVRKDEGV